MGNVALPWVTEPFSQFDASFFRSGEGIGNYRGWYFCSAPKGALFHCEKYLKCTPFGEGGYIYCCEIKIGVLDEDIDGCYTDHPYGRPIYGVKLRDSHRIRIKERIAATQVFTEVYGDPYTVS